VTATIYETVAAMIALAMFLTATGSLMISTATRIARIVDRIRALVAMCDRSTREDEVLDFPEERRKHAIEELWRLQRRSDRAIAAVTLLYTAFGSFAATSMAIAIDSMAGHRIPTAPTLFAIAGVALLLAASANLVVEARTALRSNDLEVQFFFELERNRGEPVIDASAGHHHGQQTDPASRDAEPGRERGYTLDRSDHGT
jgi:ABC-type Na+ efflux pump permease subunit